MKRTISTLILAGTLIAFTACQKHQPSTSNHINGQSALTVDNPHFKLGEISKKEKDTVCFFFDIENISNQLASIDKIDVSCNCVKIDTKTRPIYPHSKLRVNGHINLKSQYGHLSKSLFITYNSKQLLLLRVIGDIKE